MSLVRGTRPRPIAAAALVSLKPVWKDNAFTEVSWSTSPPCFWCGGLSFARSRFLPLSLRPPRLRSFTPALSNKSGFPIR